METSAFDVGDVPAKSTQNPHLNERKAPKTEKRRKTPFKRVGMDSDRQAETERNAAPTPN